MKVFYKISLASLALIAFGANAQTYQFSGGKGTADDPYQIKTAEDLNHVRDFTENSDVNFKLMNDIDLSEFLGDGERSWQPIGDTTDNSFIGTFDGNGFTISNMTIYGGGNGLGFFGRTSTPAVVKNLTIDNAEVVGGNWCGILNSTNGNWQRKGGIIINCHVTNSYLSGVGSIGAIAGVNEGSLEGCSGFNNTIECSGNNAGGLVGEATPNGVCDSHITDCFSYATVSGVETIGGIAGLTSIRQDKTIKYAIANCAAYGIVNATKYAGGLFSYNSGGNDGGAVKASIANNCFTSVNVTAADCGGIGSNPLDMKVQNCYATGIIKVTDGGNWAGGIGSAVYGTLADVYFSGSISGYGECGGLSGRDQVTAITNGYYNKEGADGAIGNPQMDVNFGVTGLTLEEMKSLKNFKFSDMSNWKIKEGISTPYFTNQTDPVTIDICDETGASGTYTGNVSKLYFYNLVTGGIKPASVNIADGKWSVVFEENSVFEGDNVVVFAKEDGKIPSQTVERKATKGASVASISATTARVSTGKGFVEIKVKDITDYQLISIAGTVVKSGSIVNGTETVSTESFDSGIYVLTLKSEAGIDSRKIVVM